MDEEEKEENGQGWVALIVIGIIIWFIFSKTSSHQSTSNNYFQFNEEYYEENILSRDEAIENYWDEIKDYVDGTETIIACSDESGNCYDLDADISSGYISTLYFPNGGNLDFYEEIDEDGQAWGTDEDGNGWEFTLDMDSYLVDNAIDDWSSDNGFIIE